MDAGEQAAAGVFPKAIRFAFPWRPFQARVLDFFETQQNTDRRYHVVAAPGAGKTVVGLEMVRRLNTPALVLCPTLNIRDQWIHVFARDFLPPNASLADWTTTDLAVPRPLTAITYQALHCACSGQAFAEESEEEEDEEVENGAGMTRLVEVAERLRAAGVRTVVVDEAHHLRTQWWATLTGIVEALGDIHLIALTATPPYDAPAGEWERYTALCGPVDIEVSIPEMVREGNLCPHQDYVYLNAPSPEETRIIDEFRAQVAEMKEALNRDGGFADAVAAHPWLAQPKEHIEEILDDPAYFSAMLIYTKAVKLWVPPALPKLLGVRREEVPALDLPWLELLLTRVLFGDRKRYETCTHFLDEIEKQLRRMGAIERKQVQLQSTEQIARFLTGSIDKMQSITEIVRREAGSLGSGLRMVILTDFIRRHEQPDSPFDLRPLKKIGAAPIFAALSRQARADAVLGEPRKGEGSHLRHTRFGVLSGAFVILPLTALPAWEAWAKEQGLPANMSTTTPVVYDLDYMQIKVTDANRPYLVRGVTWLFQQGKIHVLIGTRALLGEGWDAPAINSLVLASTVRTSVLSNQMRGRSLRVCPADPGKVANVWHLVCLDATDPNYGDDYALLEKRFRTFAGIGLHEDIIESGLERLELGEGRLSAERITRINGAMLAAAAERARLAERWQAALAAKGERAETVETLSAPKAALPHSVLLRVAAFDLTGQLLLGGAGLAAAIPSVLPGAIAAHPWALLTAAAGGVAALWGVGGGIRTGVRMLRHATPASSLRQIARAVLAALRETGLVFTPEETLELILNEDNHGVTCQLRRATLREQSVFLQCMRELCDPVENPRYLLLRKTFLFRMIQRVYYPVPRLLGGKKEWATALYRTWQRHVGPIKLIYTRTPAGRRLLLVARVQSSMQYARGSTRMSQWV